MVPLRKILPLILALASPAAAGPLETGQATRADLVSVDVRKPPWSAIGRINNSAYGRCSAILVAPDVALTAAHCIYNVRSRRFLQPASIHVLFGFDRGRYDFHATVARITIPGEYRPADRTASAPHDWAVLHLVEPVPGDFAPLRLAEGPPSPDAQIAAAGFAQERSEVLTASPPCRLARGTADGLLLADCRVSHGFSGGPMIDTVAGTLVGMSIAIATIGGDDISIAIPATRLRQALQTE
jgi:protease YdgD